MCVCAGRQGFVALHQGRRPGSRRLHPRRPSRQHDDRSRLVHGRPQAKAERQDLPHHDGGPQPLHVGRDGCVHCISITFTVHLHITTGGLNPFTWGEMGAFTVFLSPLESISTSRREASTPSRGARWVRSLYFYHL